MPWRDAGRTLKARCLSYPSRRSTRWLSGLRRFIGSRALRRPGSPIPAAALKALEHRNFLLRSYIWVGIATLLRRSFRKSRPCGLPLRGNLVTGTNFVCPVGLRLKTGPIQHFAPGFWQNSRPLNRGRMPGSAGHRPNPWLPAPVFY